MVQILPFSRTAPLLEKVAAFTERRQDVLAGNIANFSTPGYKTRDLPVAAFQTALQQAVRDQAAPPPTSLGEVSQTGTSGSANLDDLFPTHLFQAQERDSDALTFQDGGNRSVENEVNEMTKNSLLQTFAIELFSAQMGMLQAVISERP